MTLTANDEGPFIFISYSHHVKKQAERIIRVLQSAGYRVWFDSGLTAGNSYNDLIAERIIECDAFCCLLSIEYYDSQFCRQEFYFAKEELKKPIIPVYVGEINAVKASLPAGVRLWLAGIHAITFDGEEAFLRQIEASELVSQCKTDTVPRIPRKEALKQEVISQSDMTIYDERIVALIKPYLDQKKRGWRPLIVTTSAAKSPSIKRYQGIELDRGFTNPEIIVSNKTETVLSKPYILLCRSKIEIYAQIKNLVQYFDQNGDSLLVISDGYSEEVLREINSIMSKKDSLAFILSPRYGDYREYIMQDIALLSGGAIQYIDAEERIDANSIEQLGRAEKVVVNNEITRIIGTNCPEEVITEHICRLAEIYNKTQDSFEKEKIYCRISDLRNGILMLDTGSFEGLSSEELKKHVKELLVMRGIYKTL